MKKIEFTKMVASGNDFVVIESKLQAASYLPVRQAGKPQALAKEMCDRKFGVGADGLLVLGKSKVADVKMRIFNADGSEAEMCGNGARCVAFYNAKKQAVIETKAGIIEARVNADNVKIKLTDPRGLKLNIPIKINSRPLKVNFIDTGVAHTVIFVEGLDKIDVFNLGRTIRYHQRFAPRGTNVDFVEALSNNSIKIRTYERGVEDETLACGTGSVAAALITSMLTAYHLTLNPFRFKVHTKSGEILTVYFRKNNNSFKDIWLEGEAKIVYKGVYYV